MLPTGSRVLFVGRATLDLLYWLDQLPGEDSKCYANRFLAAPGGPAMNAAITHALLNRRSSGQILLICAIGGGPGAAAVWESMQQHGIQVRDLAAASNFQIPVSTVLLSQQNATRTIINPPLEVTELHILAESWQASVPEGWGDPPRVVLTDGFHARETLPLLRCLRAAGASICLDGGSWKPGTAEIVPLLTVAICSERFTIPGEQAGPESILSWFAAQGVPCVAVTRGPRSILGWDRGCRFEIEVEPIAAEDTLGAGDVLHGAFSHFYALEGDFESALRQAARIATLSCRFPGVEAWVEQAG